MKYEYFDTNDDCIVRTFIKIFNEGSNNIKNRLLSISNLLGYNNYAEIDVFEKYIYDNGYKLLDYKNMLVRDLKLDRKKYIVFCYKDDFYHLLPIINNTVYDKDEGSLDLVVLKVYGRDYDRY